MKENQPRNIWNQAVQEIHEEFALNLIEETKRARKAAETCRCRTCVSCAEDLFEQCEDEAYRINNIPPMDHEEEIIMHFALRRMKEEQDKKNEE